MDHDGFFHATWARSTHHSLIWTTKCNCFLFVYEPVKKVRRNSEEKVLLSIVCPQFLYNFSCDFYVHHNIMPVQAPGLAAATSLETTTNNSTETKERVRHIDISHRNKFGNLIGSPLLYHPVEKNNFSYMHSTQQAGRSYVPVVDSTDELCVYVSSLYKLFETSIIIEYMPWPAKAWGGMRQQYMYCPQLSHDRATVSHRHHQSPS